MEAGADSQVEAVVAKIDDLSGTLPVMKEVDVADHGKCLLIRHEDGEITVLGHKCTHYGAPLARGAISNGIVRCPWHGACFNARTGDIEDYPGVDSIPQYQVAVNKSNGEITVKANKQQLQSSKRNFKKESNVDPIGKGDKIVIIGGGAASLICAETLRKESFVGDVVMVSAEGHLPYDRAKLSKAPDSDPKSILIRPDLEYYKSIGVDVLLRTEATAIDTDAKTITICSGESGGVSSMKYNRLFLATGGTPRTLNPMKGWDSENIHVLRTVDDANRMAYSCQGRKVVLVGSSFIAMEIAAYLMKRKDCESVTVVCGKRSKVPFESSLGPQIGSLIMKMHEDKGVRFHVGVGVAELIYDESKKIVTQLKLTDDTVVDADVVILGIGVKPNTQLIETRRDALDDRGFVTVDGGMRTKIENIYAGGDIVSFPLQMKGGESTNIQHWQMAHKHGEIAAKSIVQSYRTSGTVPDITVDSVPFFWTVQFGISIRYAGYGGMYDSIIIKGMEKSGKILNEKDALNAKKFVAFYVKNDDVLAIATMMADPYAAKFAQRMKNHGLFKAAAIEDFLKGDPEQSKRNCVLS